MLPSRLLKSYASSVLADYLPAVHDALSRSARHASTYVKDGVVMHDFSKRDQSHGERIAFGILIPVLVILSGVFAGLTLGYMSLDETQLNVLSTSGSLFVFFIAICPLGSSCSSPVIRKQREYAKKIMPIRKNGHLLLVTLLLANMIVNETLPVISDPVLGGGVEAVVVSTVLIVMCVSFHFADITPPSPSLSFMNACQPHDWRRVLHSQQFCARRVVAGNTNHGHVMGRARFGILRAL